MKEKQYYELMENFEPEQGFETIHKNWLDCWKFMLKSFKVGYTDKIIEHLFYHFEMSNSKMFWKEFNPEYKDLTNEEMLKRFCGECSYISDRYSYDRIFRTHWLFLEVFKEELSRFKIKIE